MTDVGTGFLALASVGCCLRTDMLIYGPRPESIRIRTDFGETAGTTNEHVFLCSYCRILSALRTHRNNHEVMYERVTGVTGRRGGRLESILHHGI